jgi:hypothetical protein
MPIRYTAYCTRSVADVAPTQLLTGTTEGDLMMLAEAAGIPDDVAEAALEELRIDRVRGDGFSFYRVSYRPNGVRQIDIERWASPEEARADVAEVLTELEVAADPLLDTLRPHLEATVDVVSASFGFGKGEAMAPILAAEVVRWIASHYHGIVHADDKWWRLDETGQYVRI